LSEFQKKKTRPAKDITKKRKDVDSLNILGDSLTDPRYVWGKREGRDLIKRKERGSAREHREKKKYGGVIQEGKRLLLGKIAPSCLRGVRKGLALRPWKGIGAGGGGEIQGYQPAGGCKSLRRGTL